jgi:site-specific recombinase XerD
MNRIDLLEEQKNFLTKLEHDGKSFNTVKNYRTDLNCYNKYLASHGRELFINGMTLTEVQEYGLHLDNLYNSPNSIRRRVQAMRIFFDYLLSQGLVESNPLKQAIVSPKKVDIPRPASFPSIIQLYKNLETQTTSDKNLEKLAAYRNLVLIELIYGGGLKVSDIATLTNQSIFRNKDGRYRVMINHPKRDTYSIELDENFEKYFTYYQGLVEEQKNKNNIDFENLFYNGNPYKILAGGLSPRGIEVLFKEFSKSLATKVTAKNLRQACVFKWIAQKKKDSTIKEWLGVQPAYSLKPFHDLMKNEPATHIFKEVL